MAPHYDTNAPENGLPAPDRLAPEERARLTYGRYSETVYKEFTLSNSFLLNNLDEHRQDVVAAVAEAYYNQSFRSRDGSGIPPQTQYDQYNSRRNFNANPEDATADKVLYLDCSSFVNSVYYYTFGRNLLDAGISVATKHINAEMAKRVPDKDSELMFYISGQEIDRLKEDRAAAGEFIAELKKVLQPGDVINYYRANSGHVIMYLGDGKIIHSGGQANAKTAGGLADPKISIEAATPDEEKFGTVNVDDWDRFFTTEVTPLSQNDGRTGTKNCYLFLDKVMAISVFRPTCKKDGKMKNRPLRQQAIGRYLYRGMDIEKTAFVSSENAENAGTSNENLFAGNAEIRPLYYGNSVHPGELITYKVTIINNSETAMKSVNAVENIPSGLEFASACDGALYFKKEGKICLYNSLLEAGAQIEFTYTLRVKDDVAGGEIIDDTDTFVNGIRANRMINQVAIHKCGKELENILAEICGKESDSIMKVCDGLYSRLFGCELFKLYDAPEKVFDSFFEDNLLNVSDENIGFAARPFYGGYSVGYAEVVQANKVLLYDGMNMRLRRVLKKNLENGDVIFTFSAYGNKNTYNAYVYSDEKLYGINENGIFAELDPAALSVGSTVQDFLDTLTAYKQFIVLRPAVK